MDIASWWSGLFAGMSPASFVNFSFLPKYGVYFLQALGYTLLLNRCFGFTQVNYLYAAIYGVVGAIGSIIGDLTLSVVKRQVGIKDYGNLLPGHGGILDRFDSTMIVAPLTEILMLLIPFAAK